MNIQSIQYQDADQRSLRIACVDGFVVSAPWPCETWHNGPIQEWLAAGNEIAPATTISEEEALAQWRNSASVTSRQGEQQLIIAGLDEQVEAAIDAIEDPLQRKLTSAWYRRASTWERMNPEFIALGQALGLTDEQMDEHIREAMKL